MRITYKREGDGFQCDAICDNGYTFSFWFRHGNPPKVGSEFDHLNLSPTAKRIVYLAQRLPNNWTRLYMDNLFNSVKLYSALYLTKTLAHGVCRTNHRGLAQSIIQQEKKNPREADAAWGTTKAARLINSKDCPDALCCSVYDTKPVHILSTAAETIEWILKQRKVWSAEEKETVLMNFLRLNLFDDYNDNMNNTNISDQLRNNYRMDYWIRNKK